MARLPLTEDRVEVWLLPYQEQVDPGLEERYRALLCPEERARNQRYLVEGARRQHLLGRALVRTTLSRYAAVAPEAWRFQEGDLGRPFLAPGCEQGGLDFNLSHTEGLVALVVSRRRVCGVDVEDAARRRETLRDLALRFFAPAEAEDVRATPDEGLMDRFLLYWTLKESYIKAVGKGLTLPLDRFSFLADPGGIALRVEPPIEDDPEAWRFQVRRPTRRHRLALAVRAEPGEEVRVTTRRALPLAEEEVLEEARLPPAGDLGATPLLPGAPRG